MRQDGSSGRSTLEIIAVLVLGVILILGAFTLWNKVHLKTRAQAVMKQLVAMKAGRQAAMSANSEKALIRAEVGPYNIVMTIRNGTVNDSNKDFYWITILSSDSAFRSALEDEGWARLDPCLVTNPEGGNSITFYFPKFPGINETNRQLKDKIERGDVPAPNHELEPDACPDHAVCNAGLAVVECDPGYYKNGEGCDPCGNNVVTCDNNGNPTQCKEHFWGDDCSKECPTIGVARCDWSGLDCMKGYYLDDSICKQCGDNEYTDEAGQSYCKICEDGYISNETHTGCDPVSCDSNAIWDDDEGCVCKAGFYGDGLTCTQCENNKYTEDVGATSCSDCDIGYIHNETHTGCVCPSQKPTSGADCNEDCGCAEGLKCDATNHKCVVCQTGDECGCDGGTWDTERNKCVPTCSGDTPKTCSNATDVWCCASGTACSDTANQCLSGCEYSFEYPEVISDVCIYELTSPTLTKIKGCTAGTYCYLRYSDNACNSWFSNLPKSGYIYGKCIGMTENETTITSQCSGSENGSLGCCDASEVITDMAVVKPLQSCSNGEYCYIRWDNNANLANSAIGHFYGICLPKSENFGKNYLNINSSADEDRYNPWKI